MKKIKYILLTLICFLTINSVNAKTLTEEILEVRKGTLTHINDVNEEQVFKDKKLTRKPNSTELAYPFEFGCNHDSYCEYDVQYNGEVKKIGDLTLEEVKSEWNADPYVNNRWDANYMEHGSPSLAQGSKETYYAIYKKVGKYEEKFIDAKATIIDFEEMEEDPRRTHENRLKRSESAITITDDKIGVAVTGVKWVKIKYEFLDSETGEPVVVKGNTTYWDIDYNQGIIINSDNTNKGIYFKSTGEKCTTAYDANNDCNSETVANQLYFSKISVGKYIFDQNSGLNPDDNNNLYQDELTSTAYAITEEFEGASITRTFQYSNPLLKTQLEGENPWNGHGALFVSLTDIYDSVEHVITTEVLPEEHANIDSAQIVDTGNDVTINYAADDEYELSYIEIDGIRLTNDELNKSKDSYTFKNVTADHHIKVVYIKNAGTGLFEVGGVLLIIVIAYISYSIIMKRKAINKI